MEILEERDLPAPLTILPTSLVTAVNSSIALPPLSVTGGGMALDPILPILDTASSVALDSSGNIYLADVSSNLVCELTSAGIAKSIVPGADQLSGPAALAFDSVGNLYVANSENSTISKITLLGTVTTFVPASAGLSDPVALAFDRDDNLYVANGTFGNQSVSKVSPNGTVTTFVTLNDSFGVGLTSLAFDSSGILYIGDDQNSGVGGMIVKVGLDGSASSFVSLDYFPNSLAFNSIGALFVGDTFNHKIDSISPSGDVSPFLPSSASVSADGLAFGKDGNLYVATNSDDGKPLRKVTPGGAITILASSQKLGGYFSLAVDHGDNLYSTYFGGVLKTSPAGVVTTFVQATGAPDEGPVTFDTHGNLYVARSDNSILKVTPGGTVTTYVSPSAGLSAISHMAFDNNGDLFVANAGSPDLSPAIVSKVSPDGSVTTFVGPTGDLIDGVACDAGGNLYISNFFSSHGFGGPTGIVKVTPAGAASIFVPASANLSGALAIDGAGNLYVAASDNSVKIVTLDGTIGVFIPASAGLRRPSALAIDASGSLYVGDQNDIYKWAPALPDFSLSDSDAAKLSAIGLTLNSDGTFSGTAAGVPAVNPLTFTANAKDWLGDTGSSAVALTVGAPGSIGGKVFQDFNGNGVQDPGEPGPSSGQASALLYLDLNDDGNLDSGDPTADTDNAGGYVFTGLPAGTYTVRESPLGGVLQSKPGSGSYQVTLTAGQAISALDFADIDTSIAVPLMLAPTTPFPAHGNANADYVEAVYRAVLNRDSDASGLSFWTGVLANNAATRLQVVQGIRSSQEHFGQEVDAFYLTLLGRAADSAGRVFWVSQLEAGAREEQIAFVFLNSPEYLDQGDKHFVDSMYVSLLGRAADPAGEAYWLSQLGKDSEGNPLQPPPQTHAQVVNDFLFSSESLERLTEGYYAVFLRRQADTAGLNAWESVLQQGLPFVMIGEAFVSSDEFYNAAAANM